MTFRWAKNCLKIAALCDGALSCEGNRSPDSHMPGLTRRILFRSLSITPLYYTALIVSPSGTNSLPIEENHKHDLHTRLLKSKFFRPWRGFSDPCSGLTLVVGS